MGSGPLGAEFTIHKQGDAPTLETEFAFLFGVAEVKMRAANGTAVVSSIVLESDDLDEIDWVCRRRSIYREKKRKQKKRKEKKKVKTDLCQRKHSAVTPAKSRPTISERATRHPTTGPST